MLTSHLARLGLVCAACLAGGRAAPRLELRFALHTEATGAGADLLEGILACPGCVAEYPVIDGVPVVVADLAGWAARGLDAALRRHDMSPLLERSLAGVVAADTPAGRELEAASRIVGAHWGDRQVGAEVAPPGSFARRYAAAIAALPSPPRGPWLVLRCAAGRAAFQLAEAGADLAIGVDLDLALLRRAEQGRRTGRVEWLARDAGRAFTPALAEVGALPRERVGFLCADASAPPIAPGTFAALALDG